MRITPAAVARPVDVEDLVELVGWAATEGISLIPRGAGTGMPAGNVGPGVVVDLTGWTRLGDVDGDARLVRAESGVTGARVDAAARTRGLFLPALPSSADRCTVGGMVANNAAGARSFRHGPVRAWVDAVDVVLADGAVTTLRHDGAAPASFGRMHAALKAKLGSAPIPWPQVRKNSSGYALDAFLPSGDPVALTVGSEGTLALVTGVELRLAPEPPQRILVLLPTPELECVPQAVAVADAVGAESCEFFGSTFLDIAGLREHSDTAGLARHAQALVLLELAGPPPEVSAALAAVHALAEELGVTTRVARTPDDRTRLWSIRHAASPIVASRADEGSISMQFIEDSVVPPERLVEYLRSLESILAEEETEAVMFGHAGDANVHVNPLVDVRRRGWRARVRRILAGTVDLVAQLGGTLSGEHGDGRLRAPFMERIWGASVAEAFRDVKRSLDPACIFNPGVIVPLPGQDPLAGLGAHHRRAP